jgi:hypothetical protein
MASFEPSMGETSTFWVFEYVYSPSGRAYDTVCKVADDQEGGRKQTKTTNHSEQHFFFRDSRVA